MAKETGGRAFPSKEEYSEHGNSWFQYDPGMDLRPYAAIYLRIPDSGIDWLDKMIAQAERRDIAAKAMQTLVYPGSNEFFDSVAKEAYNYADAMIAERAKGE